MNCYGDSKLLRHSILNRAGLLGVVPRLESFFCWDPARLLLGAFRAGIGKIGKMQISAPTPTENRKSRKIGKCPQNPIFEIFLFLGNSFVIFWGFSYFFLVWAGGPKTLPSRRAGSQFFCLIGWWMLVAEVLVVNVWGLSWCPTANHRGRDLIIVDAYSAFFDPKRLCWPTFDMCHVKRILVSKYYKIQHLGAFWLVSLKDFLFPKSRNNLKKDIHHSLVPTNWEWPF